MSEETNGSDGVTDEAAKSAGQFIKDLFERVLKGTAQEAPMMINLSEVPEPLRSKIKAQMTDGLLLGEVSGPLDSNEYDDPMSFVKSLSDDQLAWFDAIMSYCTNHHGRTLAATGVGRLRGMSEHEVASRDIKREATIADSDWGQRVKDAADVLNDAHDHMAAENVNTTADEAVAAQVAEDSEDSNGTDVVTEMGGGNS